MILNKFLASATFSLFAVKVWYNLWRDSASYENVEISLFQQSCDNGSKCLKNERKKCEKAADWRWERHLLAAGLFHSLLLPASKFEHLQTKIFKYCDLLAKRIDIL